jgi:hypothetical protein
MVRSRRRGTPLTVAILRYNQNCWAFPFCFITFFFQLNLMLLNKEAPIAEEFNVGIEVVFRKVLRLIAGCLSKNKWLWKETLLFDA